LYKLLYPSFFSATRLSLCCRVSHVWFWPLCHSARAKTFSLNAMMTIYEQADLKRYRPSLKQPRKSTNEWHYRVLFFISLLYLKFLQIFQTKMHLNKVSRVRI